jgi:hypothetical protein
MVRLRLNEKHRLSGLPEYAIWEAMIQRCVNPANKNYPRYGGRGIRVCERWAKSFLAFIEDVGRRPSDEFTIERKNTNGNYEPGNVRWATFSEQNRNLRTNRVLRWKGRDWIIRDLARAYDMAPCTLHKRLASGWPLKTALLTKPRRVGRRVWAEKQPEGYESAVDQPKLRRTRRVA